ncbi:hypothetical protein FZ103_00390 [Streptomonospora sp. PA3]|uniref:type II secretion system F family protein n=1 Tax=Streptomonospora sp. PA3 TaxID=2607326 RepID=UPI0012DE65E4|nr:type II secretion system F family protein [Streptomonospora sp. PA3]MUL39652.1 hypothetical protein [Streptomonospora sp. PA3]
MSAHAPVAASSAFPPLPDAALAWAHGLAGQAGCLLALGCLGVIAAGFVPGPATVRLRGLMPAGGERRGGWVAQRAERLARGLRARLELAAGRVQGRRRRAGATLCGVLAAELRAGRDPGAAMVAAVAELDTESRRELAALSAAGRSGQDVVPTLRTLAAAPGAGGLGQLAACWRVAASTGAGLADAADRLAAALSAEEALRRELGAQLAGPRATAVLLSVLPVLGLGMATALGGSPLAFLFTTPAGLLCLAAGLVLDAVGLFWTHRMVRRVLSESGME